MTPSARIIRNCLGDLMLIVRNQNRLYFAASFCHSGDGVAELLGHIDDWNMRGESIDSAVDQAFCDALRNVGVSRVIHHDREINLNHQGLADLVVPRTA